MSTNDFKTIGDTTTPVIKTSLNMKQTFEIINKQNVKVVNPLVDFSLYI